MKTLKNKTVMGYAIQETGNPEQPYNLLGNRGGIYFLHRCANSVHTFFARNLNGNSCAVKGNYRFSDNDHELVPVS